MRRFAWPIFLIAAAAAVAATVVSVERNPVRTHPRASAASGAPLRLIVKLQPAAAIAGVATPSTHERLNALAVRSGLALERSRTITGELHAIQVDPVAGESLTQTLARVRADPEVRYAEPDQVRYVHTTPNDPDYASGQWYLMPSSAATPSAIDAQTAWNFSTGSATLVIADIDTGVRYEHPDLLAVSSGGRLLPGYCFITTGTGSGAPDTPVANDNTCPGPDASDPGDWITQADLTNPNLTALCAGASITGTLGYIPSSWHGTRVAGVLGALTNNSLGIAGVTWGPKILPVRALGVCGGWDSDILSGVLWAAGFNTGLPDNVSAPANPNRANIINLSLGATAPCSQSWQDIISQVTATGVVVVASVGNEEGLAVDSPANCPGVIAVAGLRHAGTKVGFSNLGPEIALGAPAGNCINTTLNATTPCVYPITSTTNLGSQGPDPTNDYTGDYYCDTTTGANSNCQISGLQYRTYNLGTSFAAPQVAGIVALMKSVNSNLNVCQITARLKEGALPYPQTSVGASAQPPVCQAPSATKQDECICTLDGQTCGAGMANASGAVAAAQRPIAAVALPAAVSTGQAVQLSGTGSGAISGNIMSYAWSVAGGAPLSIQNSNTATASVTIPACGLSTVALTVTDNAGRQDTADVVVSPAAVTTTAPASAGQTSCSTSAPAVIIDVCPTMAAVQAGSGTAMFTATLGNTTNTAVTWEVNGIAGGNAQVGTISPSGVYTPPAAPPDGGLVTVAAVSSADASATASAQVTVTAPPGGGGGGGGGFDFWTLLLSGASALRRRKVRSVP